MLLNNKEKKKQNSMNYERLLVKVLVLNKHLKINVVELEPLVVRKKLHDMEVQLLEQLNEHQPRMV